ncbi:gp436 family protein [Pseudidiomarina aestuarii]|uniref:gp436 family protein n=1 Tax=Pseudidiomarina aestuarii TaxID=624146 RepID=UPI003A97B3AC
MNYCLVTDLIARFGEQELIALTDRDGTGTVVEVVAQHAIQDASALIDGYLLGRYDLPLQPAPTVLTPICADIARYQLYDNEAPAVVTKRYETAIQFLKSVGKGEVTLGVNDAGAAPGSTDLPEIQSGGNIFNRKNSKGFI